jgi:hypothetical protein
MSAALFRHAELVFDAFDGIFDNPQIDPQLSPEQRIAFTGMAVVAASTSYELAIKSLLRDFIKKQSNDVLANLAEKYWAKINGRIQFKYLAPNYLSPLGDNYSREFKTLSDSQNNAILKKECFNAKACYDLIIVNRNHFVRGGTITSTELTFQDVQVNFERGGEVIDWFAQTLQLTDG